METSKTGIGSRVVGGGLIVATALGLAGAVTLTSPRGLAAQGDGQGRVCSEATLRGDYGLLASGVRGLGPGVTERFVAAGFWTFDGNGGFTFGPGGALHGEISGINPDPEGLTGTYEVNPNCSGTLSWQPPEVPFSIDYAFVIVANGREVKAVVTSPASNIVTAELTRK